MQSDATTATSLGIRPTPVLLRDSKRVQRMVVTLPCVVQHTILHPLLQAINVVFGTCAQAEHYDLALGISPLHPDAWFALGYCRMKTDRPDAALQVGVSWYCHVA